MNCTEQITTAEPIIEDEEINPEGEEFTQEDIDDLPEFWEGEDPFDMCDECKRLGYCKRELVLEDSTITNMIPLRADGDSYKSLRGDAKWYLQAAFDAFHQKRYSTSIAFSKLSLKNDNCQSEPFLVIAVCLYFLGRYEEAINQYKLYLGDIDYLPIEGQDKMNYFIWHCENMDNLPF